MCWVVRYVARWWNMEPYIVIEKADFCSILTIRFFIILWTICPVCHVLMLHKKRKLKKSEMKRKALFLENKLKTLITPKDKTPRSKSHLRSHWILKRFLNEKWQRSSWRPQMKFWPGTSRYSGNIPATVYEYQKPKLHRKVISCFALSCRIRNL